MEPTIPTADQKLIARRQRRELFRTPSFIVGSAIVLFWLACALVPGLFTTRGAQGLVLGSEGTPIPRVGPRADAWFGTDLIGNDVFARVIYGAEHTVITALSAAVLAVVVGAAAGLMMGTSRGWLDEVLSGILEAIVSLPVVLFAIMVFAIYGRSRLVMVLTIASLSAPLVAKAVRSAVLVQAQRAGAASATKQSDKTSPDVWPEIFPNVTKFLLVESTERFRYAIFAVATLSFLGFGADAQDADWGRDFADYYALIGAGQWWSAFFPALAISSLVAGTNLIGDAVDKVYQARSVALFRAVVSQRVRDSR